MKSQGIGRFVADPVLRDAGGTSVCDFTLAFNEYRKSKDGQESYRQAHFFEFVVWDKAAEFIVDNAKKGDRIFVECTARQDKWEDKEGQKRQRTFFRVNSFELLDRNKSDNSSENSDTATEVADELPA
jgi:single-strand DNA-binding protein